MPKSSQKWTIIWTKVDGMGSEMYGLQRLRVDGHFNAAHLGPLMRYDQTWAKVTTARCKKLTTAKLNGLESFFRYEGGM